MEASKEDAPKKEESKKENAEQKYDGGAIPKITPEKKKD